MYLPGLLPIKLPAVAVRQLMEDADAGSNFNNSYIFIVCMYVCDSMYVCMYVILFLFLPEGKLLDISLPDQTVKRQNGEVCM